ncbi:hypothetical protein HELRODRAFT_157830 [Helobdella robusta]|uniref:Pre-mRNA-splicing factor 18 n=1 Tax=Helobdella robusta TaxID=6412 RepID=T1EMG5_HELRO|nr:hypothetical protein HELRODRAFT_157830 [Helobdella robusta]ESN93624.1 hypothetical protein HELRODRAFT_157830 [Helobdella robusta]
MDILKQEIAKKKQLLENKSLLAPNKKYFKRSELVEKEREEYWQSSKRSKVEIDKERASILCSFDENSQGSNSSDNPEEEKKKVNLSRKEVIRRLRERDEPIRLFGESDYESFLRLRKLEVLEPEVNKGFKNDFQDAMDKVDEDYVNELLKSSSDDSEQMASLGADVKVKDDGTTYEEVLKMSEDFGKGNAALDSQVMLKFLKLVLNIWGEELNKRPPEVKRSLKGKVVSATHMQTVAYIKPLFRKLKKQAVSDDIFACLVDIVKFMIERHYLKANEAYLEMAIGNAPWPIGVTMVGIHARTGREKIFAKNVAHVLNDETQRKYIQALKRLMTQAQKYFPTDPSKSVNFESQNKLAD